MIWNPVHWPSAGWTAIGTWAISLGGTALWWVTRAEARHARHQEMAPALSVAIETEFDTTLLIVRHDGASRVPAIDRLLVTMSNSRSGHSEAGPIFGPWRLGNGSDGTTGRTAPGYTDLIRGQSTQWRVTRTDQPNGATADEYWTREWWTEPALIHLYVTVGRHVWPYTVCVGADPLNVGGSAVSSGDVVAPAGPRLSHRAAGRWQAAIGPANNETVQNQNPPIGP